MQPVDLSNKTILITGGSLGIGYASAKACLKAGGRVVICARNPEIVKEAVEKLAGESEHARIKGVAADVTEIKDLEKALDLVESSFGPVNAVIHAAGILGAIGPVVDTDPVKWQEAIQVNLFGTFLTARQSCRRMEKHGGGRIVFFSGGGASTPFPNYTSYACSKVGVVRFTETLAEEVAPLGIEVNCLGPGFVLTRLHQQTLAAGPRAGKNLLKTEEELARGGVPASKGGEAAAFLISDSAKGITGKFMAVPYDGWQNWPQHLDELKSTDIFTLRRILPKDRAMNWQ